MDNHTSIPNDSQSEEWRVVPGLEDYEVSNLGRVKQVHSPYARRRNRILKPVMNYGYCQLYIGRGANRALVKVHRLVLIAFVGAPPNDDSQCNHINGIRNDNRLENLEWVTPKENTQHGIQVLGHVRYGEHAGGTRLTDNQVHEIRALIKQGAGLRKTARVLGIPYSTLWAIVHRRSWKHI